jgi:hypothetical protein
MALSLVKKRGNVKISEHFRLGEYFPPEMIESHGLDCLKFLHPDVVSIDEELRRKFGPCEINNWLFGGSNTLRGVRPFDCDLGAKMSAHKFGMASDKTFKTPAKDVIKWIIENEDLLYINGLRRVETDVNWVHTDLFDDRSKTVRYFKP